MGTKKKERNAEADAVVARVLDDINGMLVRKGWARVDLARALGIDAAQMSNILNGVQGLTIPRMLSIYRALGAVQLVRELRVAAYAN